MSPKWFGKKEEAAPAPPQVSARKPLLLYGSGFSARLWARQFERAGVAFTDSRTAPPEQIAATEFEIIVETESDCDLGLMNAGSGEIWNAPSLVPRGLILVPCYTASPTSVAHTLDVLADTVVGYTLFSPPNLATADPSTDRKPVIELARALQTCDGSWDDALGFAARSGMEVEIAGDAPGLVFGRNLAMLINEACHALGEGIASARDIDTAMRLGVNYPRGLFEWADDLGADFILDILEGLMSHYEDPRYRPAPLLRHMVLAGKKFLPEERAEVPEL